MITFFNYLLILNIFMGASRIVIFQFEFYLGYVFVIWFLISYVFLYRSFRINSNFLIVLIILIISSLVNACFGNNSVLFIAKQVVGILLTGSAYYLLIKINDYSIERLFKVYLRIALVVAAIGVFQEFSYLIKFKPGYDYRWLYFLRKWSCDPITGSTLLMRVNSIFTEPSHFAISMAPAFLVSLLDIFKKNPLFLKSKWFSLIIIVSYILTFSVVAYIGILISLFLIVCYKRLRYPMLAAIIVTILVFGSYKLPDVRIRVDSVIAFLKHPQVVDYNKTWNQKDGSHMSIYAVLSNGYIAFSSFINNFLFGSGIGSHPVSYDKFFNSGVANGFLLPTLPVGETTEICRKDSGSLFLRLLSETGLFGVIAVFYFIFRFRLKLNTDDSMAIISNAIFILFVLQLLRMGHYFYNGLFFFVWAYYFAYRIYNSKISE